MGKVKDLTIEAEQMLRELPKSYRERWLKIIDYAQRHAQEINEFSDYASDNKKEVAEMKIICNHLLNSYEDEARESVDASSQD